MKKTLTALLLTALIVGCTTIEDISSSPSFQETLGKEQEMKRISYLYEEDGTYIISDTIIRFGRGLDGNGNIVMHTVEPKETIPIGTHLDVERIEKESSKGGVGIYAYGTIHLKDRSVPFNYLLGLRDSFKDAPWVSPVYEPRNLKKIEPARAGNG